ncbi:MAG: hypothetical protein AAF213_11675 [Pseudomonadota bacterium]
MAGFDWRLGKVNSARAVRTLVMLIAATGLAACEPDTGSGIGERARIVSDKDPTGQKLEEEIYSTPSRLVASIQTLTGAQLYEFQLEELVKIDAALAKSFNNISLAYLDDLATVTGVNRERLAPLRQQFDTQTVSVDKTVLFPFVEAKRQRRLSEDQKELIRRLDRQRRLDMTHIRNRYAQQISAITGLSLPDVAGVLVREF